MREMYSSNVNGVTKTLGGPAVEKYSMVLKPGSKARLRVLELGLHVINFSEYNY